MSREKHLKLLTGKVANQKPFKRTLRQSIGFMLGTAEPEIREQFEKAVALAKNDNSLPFARAHGESVRDALGWILGEYTERPIE